VGNYNLRRKPRAARRGAEVPAMRKPRVVIFDDEVFILNMLRDFFLMRGYEVLSYRDPTALCPLFESQGGVCAYETPCADIMITDFAMPGVNGVELLERQQRKGCRQEARNKAVISGIIDDRSLAVVREMGCMFFSKPFTLFALSEWVSACEQRMDLSRPLATRRSEERFDSYRVVTFRIHRTDQPLTGVAVNVSPSGLCIKAPAPLLRREDTISIDAGHFAACTRASVRWVRYINGSSCLAGLSCCSA
jgi:DNA-binding response OmpR family regulator